MSTIQIIEDRTLPPLTVISKGRAIPCNQNVPPLTIISKGKAINSSQIPVKQQLQLQQAQYAPPLSVFPTRKQKNVGKRSKKAGADKPISMKPTTLILKQYGKVSAAAPFFGQEKASKIPISTATNSHRQQDSIMFNAPENSISDAINAYVEIELGKDNRSDSNFVLSADQICIEPSGENPKELIVETADKAVQTDCFCNCISRRDDASVEEIARKIADHLSLSMDETKKKNKMSGIMYKFFPIKTTECLERIDYNMRNTANFEIRLNVFLKHLKSRTSTDISTAFRELVSDEFLKGRNWDGSKGQMSMCMFEFFNITIFEAWKNSNFSKDAFIDAMKTEIKKAHDRLAQANYRKRKRDDQEEM